MNDNLWSILDAMIESEGTTMGLVGQVIESPGPIIRPAKKGDDDAEHENADDWA